MSSQRSSRLRYEQPLSSSSSLFIDVAPPSFLNRLWISLYSRVCLSLAANSYAHRLTRRKSSKKSTKPPCKPHRRQVTIDILPEDALLEIFDFYLHETDISGWHKLVHVCRKWRNVVFGSPRRLDLRIYCDARTPVRKMNIWPELPIAVWSYGHEEWGMDNIFATLEHVDRICHLRLFDIPSSQSEKVLAEMQQPFPVLTALSLMFSDETPPIVPASFLGGSAPLLRSLELNNIPFPGLPKLLLSATHLVSLRILDIPYSGHFSPEVLVTCLSATRLNSLMIGFESPRSRAGRKSRHPPPRTLFPFLTYLLFKGVCEYLEDLVARIDAPHLDGLDITFFHQLIFETPQLAQFICHAPKLKVQDGAHVELTNRDVRVELSQTSYRTVCLGISCSQSDWQLSSLAQVCSSSIPQALIRSVEGLYISKNGNVPERWQDDIESIQWLELFHPFTAMKDLTISWDLMPHFAPTLQELVGERTMEVLPALQSLTIEVPRTLAKDDPISFPSRLVQESIERFVAARELAGHPITLRHWNLDMILNE